MLNWLRDWRTRRFMRTLPPIVTEDDGGQWALDKFEQQMGRPFNPFSARDRDIMDTGIWLAVSRAIHKVFRV